MTTPLVPLVAATGWTTLADARARLRRRWDSGEFLRTWASGAAFDPIEVALRGPSTRDLTERFDEVRAWRADWLAAEARSPGFRLTTRAAGGRSIGLNALPARLVVEGWDSLWQVLGVTADVRRFEQLCAVTADGVVHPSEAVSDLLGWVHDHPMAVLRYDPETWARLLATARWLCTERDRGRYLRQVPVPGVDTKVIEANRSVLADLLDVLLPVGAVDPAVPRSQFERRYGFHRRPQYVRFRRLGSSGGLLGGVSELGIRVSDFEAAAPDVGTVFVLENEITYLAFPDVPDAIAVFGSGYALSGVAALAWFAARRVRYWGDIDTHGFVILDRLRAALPHVESLLMDRETLLAHRDQWVREPRKATGRLEHLTPEEAAVHHELLVEVHGPAVRLEQERVSFQYLERALGGG